MVQRYKTKLFLSTPILNPHRPQSLHSFAFPTIPGHLQHSWQARGGHHPYWAQLACMLLLNPTRPDLHTSTSTILLLGSLEAKSGILHICACFLKNIIKKCISKGTKSMLEKSKYVHFIWIITQNVQKSHPGKFYEIQTSIEPAQTV